ncbi:hypothetical protein HAX54_016867 [Datura stramonium]|uniref:Uncharacterized protein n=1 Tax=Datura stramonium TaxID=4076 RepID=A0ABS8RJJ3_DATST|nr:hypothetical protein [Datura stramonium]
MNMKEEDRNVLKKMEKDIITLFPLVSRLLEVLNRCYTPIGPVHPVIFVRFWAILWPLWSRVDPGRIYPARFVCYTSLSKVLEHKPRVQQSKHRGSPKQLKKMSVVLNYAAPGGSPSCVANLLQRKWKAAVLGKRLPSRTSPFSASVKPYQFQVNAFFFNPIQEPILKEALKEPVAFAGGIFAGLLRLDLNEDPLKEWVARTVEASGVTAEEIEANDDQAENTPQQIEIE